MDSVPTNFLDDNMDNQMVRHRYSWLLGAYALLVIAVPASRMLPHAQAATTVISLVFMLLVVLSGFVIATSFRFRIGMATAAIVAALLRLLANATAISALDLANYALFVLIPSVAMPRWSCFGPPPIHYWSLASLARFSTWQPPTPLAECSSAPPIRHYRFITAS